MALPVEFEGITKALSGMGVEETELISTLGKSHKDHRKLFRKASKSFFVEDEERAFEKCHDHFVKHLRLEFSRFNSSTTKAKLYFGEKDFNAVRKIQASCDIKTVINYLEKKLSARESNWFKEHPQFHHIFPMHKDNAVVMWTMHPWERDARLVKKALKKGDKSYNLIVEVSCTRSSEDLLGARRAYHSLFDQSMEEDIASHVYGPHRKLLVGLVSAFRYEGNKVKDDTAKSEAKILAEAVASSGDEAIEKDEFVRILSTRSKLHLQHVYKHFNEIHGSDLLAGVSQSSLLNEALVCLIKPSLYFSKILDASLSNDADKATKKWLTRVLVTRADHSDEMKDIKEEYHQLYGQTLDQKIQEKIKGNYRDFLLTLLSKSD